MTQIRLNLEGLPLNRRLRTKNVRESVEQRFLFYKSGNAEMKSNNIANESNNLLLL